MRKVKLSVKQFRDKKNRKNHAKKAERKRIAKGKINALREADRRQRKLIYG